MRAVLQRVQQGSVSVEGDKIGSIAKGLVILLGIGQDDSEVDMDYLVDKIVNLRIFTDVEGKLNLSAIDVKAEVLIISQFTLFGDCRKGRRPSFSSAASPDKAKELYEQFIAKVQEKGLKVATGKFQAEMLVEIHNHGPVTLLLDSKKVF